MHVAVLGGGYAGLALTRRLEADLPADVEITLVDERDTHLVQHLVHRVIRNPGLAEDIRRPLSDLLDRATHRQARVEAVDADAGTATLDSGQDLSFDLGAVCLGAQTDFHGLPGVADHATPCKRVAHAEAIREEFLALCAHGDEGPDQPGDPARVVVGGAGLAGIQVAGELATLARERDAGEGVEIVLLEREPEVAPSLPPAFRDAVAAELRARGVTVQTGARVERADGERVALAGGGDRSYEQFVWTGGIRGADALGPVRPEVRADLRLGERAFGLGDAVQVVDAGGQAVPASAQTALGQAATAATNVARLATHHREGGGFEPRLAPYRENVRGWLVTVGDGAVAAVGPTILRGRAAMAMKSTVTERYLRSVDPDRELADVVRNALDSRN